jgi:hypothetical protein
MLAYLGLPSTSPIYRPPTTQPQGCLNQISQRQECHRQICTSQLYLYQISHYLTCSSRGQPCGVGRSEQVSRFPLQVVQTIFPPPRLLRVHLVPDLKPPQLDIFHLPRRQPATHKLLVPTCSAVEALLTLHLHHLIPQSFDQCRVPPKTLALGSQQQTTRETMRTG